MKAVILAAGKSKRTRPLTLTSPKPLLTVANKPIIEWTLSQLKGLADEAVIITEKGNDQIKNHLGSSYGRLKLSYQFQRKQEGTGRAVLEAKKLVKGKFILLMGDDFYKKSDIKRCLNGKHCVLAKDIENVQGFGEIVAEGRTLKRIKEKPSRPGPGKANAGLYVLDQKIFGFCERLRKSPRGEYEFTEALNAFARKNHVAVETADFWTPITYPWNLLEANKTFLNDVKRKIDSKPEKGVTLKGKIQIGKNTTLRAGTYIEGPAVIGDNCDLGPNCYIRPHTSIADNCRIGASVEVKNCIVMENSKIGHLSYLGDSVIGKGSNIGAGFIVANLRHDGQEIKSMVNGKLISTQRAKQGVIMGEGVKTGIGTLVYPGRKIWPGKTTLPGEIVKKDVE